MKKNAKIYYAIALVALAVVTGFAYSSARSESNADGQKRQKILKLYMRPLHDSFILPRLPNPDIVSGSYPLPL